MSRNDLGHLVLAVAMTAVAGYVDAVGLLTLGDLFVSFMSGNSTQFAAAIVHGDWNKAGEAGGIIALFVIGVAGGHFLAAVAQDWRRPAVFMLEAALLGLAVALAPWQGAIVPIVLAMGVQNEALHKAGEIKTSLTYVTGTLVSFGENLASALRGGDPARHWLWLPYLLLWLGLIIGAGIGALVYAQMRIRALVWPAAFVLLCAAVTVYFTWRNRAGAKQAQEI